MKITNSNNQNLQRLYRRPLDRSQHAGEQSKPGLSKTTGARDSIELSGRAHLLETARQQIEKADLAASDRIAQLQEQVQNDTYQVPLQQLTARLMTELF